MFKSVCNAKTGSNQSAKKCKYSNRSAIQISIQIGLQSKYQFKSVCNPNINSNHSAILISIQISNNDMLLWLIGLCIIELQPGIILQPTHNNVIISYKVDERYFTGLS